MHHARDRRIRADAASAGSDPRGNGRGGIDGGQHHRALESQLRPPPRRRLAGGDPRDLVRDERTRRRRRRIADQPPAAGARRRRDEHAAGQRRCRVAFASARLHARERFARVRFVVFAPVVFELTPQRGGGFAATGVGQPTGQPRPCRAGLGPVRQGGNRRLRRVELVAFEQFRHALGRGDRLGRTATRPAMAVPARQHEVESPFGQAPPHDERRAALRRQVQTISLDAPARRQRAEPGRAIGAELELLAVDAPDAEERHLVAVSIDVAAVTTRHQQRPQPTGAPTPHELAATRPVQHLGGQRRRPRPAVVPADQQTHRIGPQFVEQRRQPGRDVGRVVARDAAIHDRPGEASRREALLQHRGIRSFRRHPEPERHRVADAEQHRPRRPRRRRSPQQPGAERRELQSPFEGHCRDRRRDEEAQQARPRAVREVALPAHGVSSSLRVCRACAGAPARWPLPSRSRTPAARCVPSCCRRACRRGR